MIGDPAWLLAVAGGVFFGLLLLSRLPEALPQAARIARRQRRTHGVSEAGSPAE